MPKGTAPAETSLDFDLIIRRAHLRRKDGAWDIGIQGTSISAVERDLPSPVAQELDAAGGLVSPAFVNPHCHLDKCFLAETMRPNRTQTLQEAIEITWDFKRRYTTQDILERATRALREAALYGTTHIRLFADVDTVGELRPVRGLLAVKEAVKDWMTVEVVAFPQEGILRDPGAADLMDQALSLGADVVGGLPWYERLDRDMRAHIDYCFELARRYDRDIHMLVDDTDNPNSRSLEYLCVKTIEMGWQGRVSASHCGALAAYDEVHARKVIGLVVEAKVNICTNPHISLVLAGRADREPIRRGVTRVKQLLQAGANVMSGQDDVKDPYYPFGRCDQAEVAAYVAHACHLTYPEELEQVFDFVTYNAARGLRLSGYGTEVGCRADVVVLAADSVQEIMRLQIPPRWVLRGGRVIAENTLQRQLHAAS